MLDTARVSALFDRVFPQIHEGGRIFSITTVADRHAVMRMAAHPRNLRPGNTLSGPSMFTLADVSIYAAILATLGETATEAVTSNLNMTFLSRPKFIDLLSETRLLKVGRRLIVADVAIRAADGTGDLVAHAVGTYARP